MRRSMSTWPKLLGISVGLFGAGCVMFTFGDCFRMGLFTNSPFVIGIGSWILVGLSAFLFALSVPLYCAHNWARLVLIALAVVASILLIVFGGRDIMRQHIAVDGDASKIMPEEIASFRRGEIIFRVIDAGSGLASLAAISCFILVLRHPDVANAFRRRKDSIDATKT
jgi:hypothetical protein